MMESLYSVIEHLTITWRCSDRKLYFKEWGMKGIVPNNLLNRGWDLSPFHHLWMVINQEIISMATGNLKNTIQIEYSYVYLHTGHSL